MLHKKCRSKILEWSDDELISGSVLTYHFKYPIRDKNDSLYLCLEIPSVILPNSRSKLVLEETLQQIPIEITNTINQMVLEYLTNALVDKLEIKDYEWELISGNASRAYNNAPINEILRFASKGTEIALNILDDNETRHGTWGTDGKLVNLINKRIQANLISDRERN